MKNKKFFKLIVINYNNYIYIKKCLDSIKNQTFKDFICIIVDDVSSDKSPDIAKIYEKRYPEQFKFIQLTTKGYPGGARNAALQFDIESEYTWFIDSDDYLYDNNVLDEMYKCILLNKKPDVIRCSYITIENDTCGNIKQKLNIEKNNINYILNSGLAPWKTCHKSDIKNQFPENCLIEDVLYGLKLFDKIDITNIPVVQKPCYVYNRMSITSLWNNPNNKKDSFFYYSQLKLIKDLINTNFNTEYCDKYAKKEIEKMKNNLNNRLIYCK